jgi:hypothetical protein
MERHEISEPDTCNLTILSVASSSFLSYIKGMYKN